MFHSKWRLHPEFSAAPQLWTQTLPAPGCNDNVTDLHRMAVGAVRRRYESGGLPDGAILDVISGASMPPSRLDAPVRMVAILPLSCMQNYLHAPSGA